MIRIAPGIALLAAGLAAQTPVIIDTDVGNDDLLAIAFLLSRKDVKSKRSPSLTVWPTFRRVRRTY